MSGPDEFAKEINTGNEIRKKADGRRMGTVVHWHHLGDGIIFDEEVHVGGGGFTGHANYFGRCMLTNHDPALPGVQPDGTWSGPFQFPASRALTDIAEHADGSAFLMMSLHGTVVGPIDPASV
jgi:hypothetical protein